MKANSEESLQLQMSSYIKMQYPNVLFNCDLSGIKLTIGQAKKVKKLRSSRAWPDMFFPKGMNGYGGLFIELKTADKRLKNGKVATSEHVKEQELMLEELRAEGYYAVFACGFDEAKKVIDYYFN
jgi:hypothetical protein